MMTLSRWLAIFTFSSYPPTEIQLEHLEKGLYRLVGGNVPTFDNVLFTDLIFRKKNMFTTSKKKCRNLEKSRNL